MRTGPRLYSRSRRESERRTRTAAPWPISPPGAPRSLRHTTACSMTWLSAPWIPSVLQRCFWTTPEGWPQETRKAPEAERLEQSRIACGRNSRRTSTQDGGQVGGGLPSGAISGHRGGRIAVYLAVRVAAEQPEEGTGPAPAASTAATLHAR